MMQASVLLLTFTKGRFHMFLIPCPWCGERDQSEFTYGGDAREEMPDLDGRATVADWHKFVHLRGNPRGVHAEYWHHTSGCERWLRVERDTVSHAVTKARDTGVPPKEAS